MDPDKLVRDASKVHADLQELEDGSVVTKKGCTIYIPGTFPEKQLAYIADEVYILGVFCIVVEEKYYGVSLANAMMRIEPSSNNRVTVGDSEYVAFSFDPGATVIASTELVRSDTLLYHINEEIIARGRIPWFMSYEDVGSIYDSAKHHAGVRLGANHAILEMIAAAIARDPDDPSKYYRQTVKSLEEVHTRPPVFVAFKNISHGASNTTSKLMGSYWSDSLTSALVNPAEKTEDIEELLRR